MADQRQHLNGTDAAQAEAALLAAFRSMTDDAREIVVGMMQSIAKGSPRQRPPLTLVASTKSKGETQ